jgi:hypothetical protein
MIFSRKYLIYIEITLIVYLLLYSFSYAQQKNNKTEMVDIKINSIPSEAGVYLNNYFIGHTPITFPAPIGHKIPIKLIKKKYVIWEKTILVDRDRVLLVELPLIVNSNQETNFHIKIQSNPHNAKVFINKKLIGHTPTAVIAQKGNKFNVLLKKKYYAYWERDIIVDENTELNARLIAIKDLKNQIFPVSINSHPVRAEVKINGRSAGYTPVAFNAPGGDTLNIALKSARYPLWEKSIIVSHDNKFSVDLTSLQKKRNWPLIGGGMAAIIGGIIYYLTSGSKSEQEISWPVPPGRP